MKVKSLIILILISIFFLSCGKENPESDIKPDDIVYICTGKLAYAFHKYKDCFGLNQCSDEIKEMKKDQALKIRKKYCTFCRKRN